jgi:hypothetical protein
MKVKSISVLKNGVFWVVTPCGSCRFLQEPHGITTQKTPFFIVTAVKTSNLKYQFSSPTSLSPSFSSAKWNALISM